MMKIPIMKYFPYFLLEKSQNTLYILNINKVLHKSYEGRNICEKIIFDYKYFK